MSDLIIEGAKGIPDGLYVIKDGELFKHKPNGGTVRSYHVTNRPTGTWEIHYNYWNGEECKCSVCGYDVCHPTWNYCPKCGSRNDDVVEVRGEDE